MLRIPFRSYENKVLANGVCLEAEEPLLSNSAPAGILIITCARFKTESETFKTVRCMIKGQNVNIHGCVDIFWITGCAS